MKPITIVTYFYDGEEFLIDENIRHWATWSDEALENIEIIVIDNGSNCDISPRKFDGFPVRFVKITDRIPWNYPGARNLGFKLASNEWVALMEDDYMVDRTAADNLIALPEPKSNEYYIYHRMNAAITDDLIEYRMLDPWEPLACPYTTKGNIFIMRKWMFWAIGGVDEDFTGRRGGEDSVFLSHLQNNGFMPRKSNVTLKHYVKNVPNVGYRSSELNMKLAHKKIAAKELPKNPFRFNWEELS